jgi:cell division septal protein FtsQ
VWLIRVAVGCGGGGLLALCFWAGILLAGSNALRITTITLHGDVELQTIQATLSHAGIRQGGSILAADLALAGNLLSQDPRVLQTIIKRRLPHTISIELITRKPVAVVQADRRYLLDSQGILYAAAGADQSALPLITGLQRDDLTERGRTSQQLLSTAVELIEQLQAQGGIAAGTTIDIDAHFGFTVISTSEHLETRLGFDRFDQKASALKRIREDLQARQVSPKCIDLISDSKAYVSLNT